MRNKRSRHVVSPGGRIHGLAEHVHPDGDRSQCEICRNNRAFDLPRQLYDAIVAGDVSDVAYFLSQLKNKLIEDDRMVPDRNFDGLPKFLLDVVDAHDRALSFDAKRFPDLLYCSAYQDGLMHAIERILAMRKSGYYSHQCNAVNAARTYQFHLRPTKLRAKQYGEVAYIDGYVAGHLYFLGDEKFRRFTPRYYVYGCDELILSMNELRVALRQLRNSHSRAHALASRIIGGIPKGMTLHHPPVL